MLVVSQLEFVKSCFLIVEGGLVEAEVFRNCKADRSLDVVLNIVFHRNEENTVVFTQIAKFLL